MSITTLNIPITTAECKPFIKQGDTISKISWDLGDTFTGNLVEDLYIIRMQIYDKSIKVINIDSTGALGGITITGAKTFEIDEVTENDLPIGSFLGDLQIEEYSDFAFDPISVETICNIQYNIVKQFSIIT